MKHGKSLEEMQAKPLGRERKQRLEYENGWARVVDEVRGVSGLTHKGTDEIVRMVLTAMKRHLAKDGRLNVPRFGTFEVRTRAAREVVCPPNSRMAGQRVKLPETLHVGFRASKHWRDL